MMSALSADPSCWRAFARRVASHLAPIVDYIVDVDTELSLPLAFTPRDWQPDLNEPDSFFWDMAKGRLLYTAALHDQEAAPRTRAAEKLCAAYAAHRAAEAAGGGGGLLDPDWRPAAYIVAMAQPPGCAGVGTKEEVWTAMLRQWQTSRDDAESQRALYALAYSHDRALVERTMRVLLEISSAEQYVVAVNPAGPRRRARSADILQLFIIMAHHEVALNAPGSASFNDSAMDYVVWQFSRIFFAEVTRTLGAGNAYTLLHDLARVYVKTAADVAAVEALFAPGGVAAGADAESKLRTRSVALSKELWARKNVGGFCAALAAASA